MPGPAARAPRRPRRGSARRSPARPPVRAGRPRRPAAASTRPARAHDDGLARQSSRTIGTSSNTGQDACSCTSMVSMSSTGAANQVW
ncbi:hypothetical protein DNL40_08510 [Xylanimonas oleitrophica]|uniref:Uncharacterized protein n=1 Tax=Xylanimonas oleitrophica TaxID=2607479 RepID=A0A2W5XTS6_9MICO|nr:hypothetical protein DNL40_08510 [Xylanimonas oleitrophica]